MHELFQAYRMALGKISTREQEEVLAVQFVNALYQNNLLKILNMLKVKERDIFYTCQKLPHPKSERQKGKE